MAIEAVRGMMPREVNLNSIGSGIIATGVGVVVVLCLAPYFASPTRAAGDCAGTAHASIQQALSALAKNDPASDREALVCMVAAVAALDTKLQGLSNGTVPFEGQIKIPNGYVMQKPQSEEAD